MTSTQRWRPVQPIDAIEFAKCRLAGFEHNPHADDYTLCGVCKYPSDDESVYYALRHDGGVAILKESILVVREEQR